MNTYPTGKSTLLSRSERRLYFLSTPDREHVFDEAGGFLNPYDRFRNAPPLGADLCEGRLVLLCDPRLGDDTWSFVAEAVEKLQPGPAGVSQLLIVPFNCS